MTDDTKPSQSEIEVLAMEMWQEVTGKTYGWGDNSQETFEFREFATEKLRGK